jgi:co-chaperonin GroES (HSP10)
MGVVVPHKAIDIVANSKNPKRAILDLIGDHSGYEVTHNWVLMATYFRPQKTSGGIIRPESNVEEDMWQSKVGLILQLGPEAFKDTADYSFSIKCGVGDWVTYSVNETRQQQVNGYPCRIIRDASITGRAMDPNIVF